jgi:hypothetical protein
MKAYRGVEVQLHGFLTSTLDGGERSASRPGRFIPTERVPSTHWIGGWVGPRASLDVAGKRKLLHRNPNPGILTGIEFNTFNQMGRLYRKLFPLLFPL